MMRYLRFLPIVALALLGWWALGRLHEDSTTRFAAAQALLDDALVLKAGAVELATCGSNGCADWADNIYRLGEGRNHCFLFRGASAADALGTGILVAGPQDEARLVLNMW